MKVSSCRCILVYCGPHVDVDRGTGVAGEIGPCQAADFVSVAQKTDDASSQSQGPHPGNIRWEERLSRICSCRRARSRWTNGFRSVRSRSIVSPIRSRRIDVMEEWKNKTEVLPILRDKVNFGLNALQFLYWHLDAHVPEGRSQDGFSIRRSELLFWGKISDYDPTLAYSDRVSKHQLNE